MSSETRHSSMLQDVAVKPTSCANDTSFLKMPEYGNISGHQADVETTGKAH